MYGGFYPGFYFDPTYILIIIGMVLSLWASAKVKTTFAKYNQVRNLRGLTGADAAREILHRAGIYNVTVTRIRGNLTDHYDPSAKMLRLSDSVYDNTSVAAIGVAAHECGHAIQDQKDYAPLRIRTALVPICNFGSGISWPLIFIGIILGWNQTLINIGILLFSAVVLFQLVTLPVEFNASSRALNILADTGLLQGDENRGARKVLTAAALTYVAGAAGSILQLLRLIILFGGRNNSDD